MPRSTCYWTRNLELKLVEFVRQRDYVWRASGNTNHHIEQKYKAYAEFAAILGRGFTARSVRDRWVNIRSTFNHNLRKVEKSRTTAVTEADVYVPCWPLWKPLQFLRNGKSDNVNETYPKTLFEDNSIKAEQYQDKSIDIKDEILPEHFGIRQRGLQTNRPRNRIVKKKSNKCIKVLDDLIEAMKPLVRKQNNSYYFFGKHVVERLNCMREIDAECAVREIMALINGTDDGFNYLLAT